MTVYRIRRYSSLGKTIKQRPIAGLVTALVPGGTVLGPALVKSNALTKSLKGTKAAPARDALAVYVKAERKTSHLLGKAFSEDDMTDEYLDKVKYRISKSFGSETTMKRLKRRLEKGDSLDEAIQEVAEEELTDKAILSQSPELLKKKMESPDYKTIQILP